MAQAGKKAETALRPLTERDLETQADGGSLSKGRSYFRSGNIVEAIARGASLQAQCIGSDVEPYTVHATLATADDPASPNPVSYECDCPRGDFCKHIVALLLTWIHKPETFEKRPPVADLLKDKTREELLTLVARMIERRPELETLLDIPSPAAAGTAEQSARATVEASAIRKQVAGAFRRNGYDWDDVRHIAGDLQRVRQLGDNYANAGQWANALVVYATLAEETEKRFHEVDDSDGDIASAMNEAAEGLGKCLEAQESLPPGEQLEPELRAQLIRALFDLWKSDMDMGGIDLAADAPDILARHVTADERAQLESWIQQQMRPAGGFGNDWRNRSSLEFLMTLKAHSGITDEEQLELYTKYGLHEDRLALLIERDRIDEAFGIAAEHLETPYFVTQFAGKAIQHDETRLSQALEFVENRLRTAEKAKQERDVDTYLRWLSDQYAAHEMPDRALAFELRLFQANTGAETYNRVKKAAHLPGQPADLWTELRPNLISAMEKAGAWGALTTIYVEEKDARHALDALAATRDGRLQNVFGIWSLPDLPIRVAEIAESKYPDEAIAIYQLRAENLIEQRGRENYQQAAGYLARMQKLYAQQEQNAVWETYIATLRERNQTLRALKEELDARKL